jgi:hypothetical protein
VGVSLIPTTSPTTIWSSRTKQNHSSTGIEYETDPVMSDYTDELILADSAVDG